MSDQTINLYWCQLLRHNGTPVPRWQQTNAVWREGRLRLKEEFDRMTGRHTYVARLWHPGRDAELLPCLIDARVILVEDEIQVITGMERDDTTRRDVAQAWMLVKGRDMPRGRGTLEPQ